MTAEPSGELLSWQRPPFEPGNLLALQHGAWSERAVEPPTREKVEALLAFARQPGSTVSYLLDPSYGPAVRSWARAETRVDLFSEWLVAHEVDCPEGCDVCGAKLDQLRRWKVTLLNLMKELGLTPVSRQKLLKDSVQAASTMYDLDKAKAEGARLVEGEAS